MEMKTDQSLFKQTELGQIPKDWEVLELGEAADIKPGYAFKSNDFVNSGIPVIKIKNIVPPAISFSDVDYVKKDLLEKLPEYKVNYNDILISLTGSNFNQYQSAVGKIGRLKVKNKEALLNQRVGKFIIKDEPRLNYGFLYYLLISEEVKFLLVSSAGGSASQANISPEQIKSLEFAFPPLPEQQKITEVLGALDDKIELNRRMNKTLESFGQAIFNNWFLGDDKDFKLGKLSDIAKVMTGKRPNSRSDIQSEEYNIPIIGASSIMGYTDEALFDDEDLIITGRVGTLGAVQRMHDACWTSDNALVTLSDYPNFTYYLMKNIDFESLNRGSTQPLITQTDLQNYPVFLPSDEQIKKYENIAESLNQKIYTNNKENETLSQIRDSLLPRLMSGKLRVR